MITEAIITIIAYTLQLIIGAIQLVTLPANVNSAFATMAIYFQKANAIFPIDTVFTILSLAFSIESAILVLKMINWALNKFRGAG